MKALTIILGVFFTVALSAQDIAIKAELYKDTVGYEETVRVTFTIENAQNVDFEAPAFESFDEAIRSGTSMNTSVINGKMTQSVGYTYNLTHFGKGTYSIEAVSIEVDGETYSSEELIVVISDEATTPNPKSEEYNPFGSWGNRYQYRMPQRKEEPKKKENPSKTSKRKKVYKM